MRREPSVIAGPVERTAAVRDDAARVGTDALPDVDGPVLDDVDARPGSTVSYLRTVIGLYLRDLGGRISAADLVRLLGELELPPARVRGALTRVKQRGLLLADRSDGVGYRLNPAAAGMLARGDRRIFAVREADPADGWCLVSFSVPESRRDLRHRLRRGLAWIGCGTVSPALWICPEHLADEAAQVVADLGAAEFVTLFRGAAPARDLPAAVRAWWDLDALRHEHEGFLAAIAPLHVVEGADEAAAFAAYVRLVDAWRILPYVDPGLPSAVLPGDWPGVRSTAAFAELSSRFRAGARRHVRAVTSR
ncbi:PaaX family transcriptional regulator [Microbacterium resistens]|uniref:PaaX family transcriptional regulator n=1 Tax=Microbacterium resistens TaxID=156977 RepID=UPI0009FE335D|nr:PaaX family transcriptional regulator C-terminal domain-containing protein [Microbacterium resistens]